MTYKYSHYIGNRSMLQSGYMKLVLQDGKYSRHSRGSFHHLVYIGHASPGSKRYEHPPSAVILSETLSKCKGDGFSRTVAFAQLKTNDVRALDNDVDIVQDLRTPMLNFHRPDRVQERHDDRTENGGGQFVLGIALDHVLNVGRFAYRSHIHVPDVLKVAGHVAPATIVLPSPINTALIDPVAIQQDRTIFDRTPDR
jgi:hypothetical protein